MSITKIAVTGGPCAGKTTALSRIQRDFSHLGYTVLIVPETATLLISGGVAPWTCGTREDFQKNQMYLQMQKELVFQQAASTMPSDKILIVCDRGALDSKAYMTEDEFMHTLDYLGTTEMEIRDGYDAVFHLVSAAKGAEEYYSLENNAARYETLEEATALDDRILAAWTGHPHLRVIGNATDFEGKMRSLIHESAYVLGEVSPFEIERKFLVSYPDVTWLESLPNCEKVHIAQTYLRSDPDDEIRIRQRGSGNQSLYYFTEKRIVDGRNQLRTQRRLTPGEYQMLLMQADPNRRKITKTRYCLTFQEQYFEVDLYPCWDDQAIVEIELSSEEQGVVFPPELHVIREITGDPTYRNAVIASKPAGATH